MKTGWRTAAGVLLALFLVSGTAFANGAKVLGNLSDAEKALTTAIENAETRMQDIDKRLGEIQDALGAGGDTSALKEERKTLKAEKKALTKGLKAARKTLPSLEDAQGSLVSNEMKSFLKSTKKAAKGLGKTEKKGGAAFGAVGLAQSLADDLEEALTQSKGSVDDSSTKPLRKAEKHLKKGSALETKGKPEKAASKYLQGIKAVMDLPVPAAGHPQPIALRALNGEVLNLGIAVAPYSPKQTCGECHDYDLITEGFHFDQGLKTVSDTFADGKPGVPDYVLSDGMFGRW
ncbi:MAG: zinc ribbon domain-containing protein [Planctomycetota bacterium]|jgi:hypothetical protein